MIFINDSFFTFRQQAMAWSEQHDILLCREILHNQPLQCQERSVVGWNCCCIELTSKVTSRSVRDRYGLLDKKYKTKWNEEEKSSGTNPDFTELDGALMGLIQRFDEADSECKKETNEKKLKIENEQKPKK